jgi:predicted DsbA family dithiol-disulfide isomerase
MRTLLVEMTFDFTCPWSLIGKRNLEKALQMLAGQYPEVNVQVNWLGIQLHPEIALEGVAFSEFHIRRLGGDVGMRAWKAEIAAAAEGVDHAVERIHVMPNTAYAHRVFAQAARLGNEAKLGHLLNRMFAAHFHRGENLGRRESLRSLLRPCGYDPADFAEALTDGVKRCAGRRVGLADISVPLFSIDGEPVLVGPQTPKQLLAALKWALKDHYRQLERRA